MGIVLGNTLTLLVYMFITLLCYLVFSPDEITKYNDVLLTMVKIIEYRFIERFDIVMLSVYLLIILRTWVPALYMAVFCTHKLVRWGKPNNHALFLLLCMVAAMYVLNPGWNQSLKWTQQFSYFGLAVAYIMPLGLLILLGGASLLRRGQTR